MLKDLQKKQVDKASTTKTWYEWAKGKALIVKDFLFAAGSLGIGFFAVGKLLCSEEVSKESIKLLSKQSTTSGIAESIYDEIMKEIANAPLGAGALALIMNPWVAVPTTLVLGGLVYFAAEHFYSKLIGDNLEH